MKRILFIIGEMNLGGAESFIMKMYRVLNKEKYQFDFVINKDGFYSEEIKRLGGKIFYTALKSKHFFKSSRQITQIVRENGYKDVIRFGTSNTSYFDLRAAKKGGAIHLGVRTLSANQGNIVKKLVSFMLRPFLNSIATIKFAPSQKAAEKTYGKRAKNVYILKNGVDFKLFVYDENKRKMLRKELNIDNDAIVFGHVGRLSKEKNHSFLIELFSRYYNLNKNSYLVLVGNGPLLNELKKEAKRLLIDKNVLFLGARADVSTIYSCFDYFLFPSFYEGMPNSLIEAQANGLTCFYSDKITKECELSKNIIRLKLNQQLWFDTISKTAPNRYNNYSIFFEKEYLIDRTVESFVEKLANVKY